MKYKKVLVLIFLFSIVTLGFIFNYSESKTVSIILCSIIFLVSFLSSFTIINSTTKKNIEFENDCSEYKRNYINLVKEINTGYAYHKMVYDKNGRAVDFIYIDVNSKFENITGFNREDIFNKKASEIYNERNKNDLFLLSKFAKVSGTKSVLHIEKYIKYIDKWIDLTVFSTGKGYFSLLLEDITFRKIEEEKKKESSSLLRSTIESTAEAIIVMDRRKNILISNEKFLDLWKLPSNWLDIEDMNKKFSMIEDKLLNPDNYKDWIDELLTNPQLTGNDTINLKDGRIIEMYAQPYIVGNKRLGKVFTYMDVTDKKQSEEEMKKQKVLLNDIFVNIQEGIQIIDENEVVSFSNPASDRIFEEKEGNLLGKSLLNYLDEEHKKLLLRQTEKRRKNKSSIYELQILTAKGNHKSIQLSVSPRFDNNGNYKGAFAAIIDITEQKKVQEQLKSLATTDYLTGIMNRRHYVQMTEKELRRSRRYNNPLSVILIDIDRFKLINDNYGHLIGDKILKELCYICKTKLRDSDIFGRIGGEEFMITMLECDVERAKRVAERIRKAIEELNVVSDNSSISFTISAGIAEFSNNDDFYSLLQKADDALYIAKNKGRNRIAECVV